MGREETGRPAQAEERVPPDVTAAIERALATVALSWSRADREMELRLSPVQLRTLEAIARHGMINLRGLGEELSVIPSSASRLCDRLEAAGLIVRTTAAEDRREILVELSPDGRRMAAALTRRRRSIVSSALADLSPTARARLLDALSEFAAACQARGLDEPPAIRSGSA